MTPKTPRSGDRPCHTPDGLGLLVQQFPIVVLVLGVIWVVLKWSHAAHLEELAREKARVDERIASANAEIARSEREREQLKQEHRENVARATELLKDEITQLRARNTKLQNQLDAILGRTPKEDNP